MIVPAEILKDLAAALEIANRDTSPAWFNAVATTLELCACDIRKAAEKKNTPTAGSTPDGGPSLSQP